MEVQVRNTLRSNFKAGRCSLRMQQRGGKTWVGVARRKKGIAILLPSLKGILTENWNAHYGQIGTKAFCHHAWKVRPRQSRVIISGAGRKRHFYSRASPFFPSFSKYSMHSRTTIDDTIHGKAKNAPPRWTFQSWFSGPATWKCAGIFYGAKWKTFPFEA